MTSSAHLLVAPLVAMFGVVWGCAGDSAVCEEHRKSLAARNVQVEGTCASEDASASLASLGEALQALPAEHRTSTLSVRLDESAVGAEREPHVPPTSRTIVFAPSSRAARDPSIWLHEIAHVRARGTHARYTTSVARLRRAVEEGMADYYAASARHEPLVGAIDGREVRNVREAPPLALSEWATLPFPSAPFDAHRFGGALAALAFEAHEYDLDLARIALDALARNPMPGSEPRTPLALVEWLTPGDVPRSSELRLLLCTWLPSELRTNEIDR